jgi:hypothetical protein
LYELRELRGRNRDSQPRSTVLQTGLPRCRLAQRASTTEATTISISFAPAAAFVRGAGTRDEPSRLLTAMLWLLVIPSRRDTVWLTERQAWEAALYGFHQNAAVVPVA